MIKSNLNPSFKSFKITAQKLCNCDPYRPIIISVYDWDKNSSDDLIGAVSTNMNELKSKPKGLAITRSQKKNKKYGQINVDAYESVPLASFLDYMQSGAEISLCAAIDVSYFYYFHFPKLICAVFFVIVYRLEWPSKGRSKLASHFRWTTLKVSKRDQTNRKYCVGLRLR